jgi:hypothetical protein
MALELIFAMTYTTLDDYLLFGKQIIVMLLHNSPMAQVRLPSSEKNDEFKEMVRMRHPYLTDVWCTMDGLKVTLKQSGDHLIWEQYYNGWTHEHYVFSVLCFCLNSSITIAFINIPGSVHDSQIVDYGSIYNKLKSMNLQDGAKYTVNSAFGNVNQEFLIKSSQDLILIKHVAERRIAADATSMRQLAEWGMHKF